jgi:hypothetical protein
MSSLWQKTQNSFGREEIVANKYGNDYNISQIYLTQHITVEKI